MPKLAIYVPKDEMKLVDKWRKKLNFSQVFMRALQQEIQSRSRVVRAGKDQVAAAAEHYRQQLSQTSQSLVDFAFEVGSEQVLNCQLTAESIQRLLTLAGAEALDESGLELINESLGSERTRVETFLKENHYDEERYPTARREIAKGYLQGVAQAWKKVCERI